MEISLALIPSIPYLDFHTHGSNTRNTNNFGLKFLNLAFISGYFKSFIMIQQ